VKTVLQVIKHLVDASGELKELVGQTTDIGAILLVIGLNEGPFVMGKIVGRVGEHSCLGRAGKLA
jgi:hypothetical protein